MFCLNNLAGLHLDRQGAGPPSLPCYDDTASTSIKAVKDLMQVTLRGGKYLKAEVLHKGEVSQALIQLKALNMITKF